MKILFLIIHYMKILFLIIHYILCKINKIRFCIENPQKLVLAFIRKLVEILKN